MRSLSLILLVLAVVCIQALIGGVRMVFSLPAYLMLGGAAIAFVLARRPLGRVPLVCAGSVFLLAAWVEFRAFSSPVAYLARPDALMVVAILLVYLMTVMRPKGSKTQITLIAVLLICAIAHAAVGAVQFKRGDNFMLLPGIMRPDYGWRASGFYICPNHLAGLLEMTGLLALGLTCWGNIKPAARILMGYGVFMCLAGLAITGSRGGYLSMVFGLGVFISLSLWVVHLNRHGGVWLVGAASVAGAVVIVGGAFFFMSQSESLHSRLAQIYDPANMRFYLWKAALRQYHLQPLTGTGSGTYLYYGRQFRSPTVQNDPMHAHNDYLELLAEYGLLGAVLSAGFLIVHFSSGLIGMRNIVRERLRLGELQPSQDLALIIGALSALSALVFHSLLDFNMHIPANALLAALLFGLLARPASDAPARNTGPDFASRMWRVVTAATALVLIGVSVRFLPGEYYAEKARVALRDDRNADAEEFARRGIAREKGNPSLYGYLGEAKHFLTLTAPDTASARILHEDAVAAYQTGLKLFPQDTGLLLKEAQALDLLERYPEADEVFQQLLRFDPMFRNVYAYYGLHWQRQQRIAAAERCFRIAVHFGEPEIAPRALSNIERMKDDPAYRPLVPLASDVEIDLPAERLLPKP